MLCSGENAAPALHALAWGQTHTIIVLQPVELGHIWQPYEFGPTWLPTLWVVS